MKEPRISVLLTAGDSEAALCRTLASLVAQDYPNWEAWICGSLRPATEAMDARFHLGPAAAGPASALNGALECAAGEYVGALSAGEEVSPDGFRQLVASIDAAAPADVLYSDEAIDTPEGGRVPLPKPDWSPELLVSYPYVGRLCLLRRALVRSLGGWDERSVAAGEYELLLRAAAHGASFVHVPKALCCRSADSGPDRFGTTAAVAARRWALEAYAREAGIAAEVVDVAPPVCLRLRHAVRGAPLVSIIIPTRDRVDLLRRCLGSIESRTAYQPYEIVIVDNGSTEPGTAEFLERCGHRVVGHPGAFNFAAINNAGARAARGEYLVLLNNDTEVVAPEWLSAMLEWAQQPGVGCVGAKLLLADGRFQHVGVELRDGSPEHVFYQQKPGQGNRWADTELVRNYSAVTAACAMIRRETFEQVGGFDESFPVNYNDVDLCLRLLRGGHRNVYTPYAVLYHHESSSRPPGISAREKRHLVEAHGERLWKDPYRAVAVPTGAGRRRRARAAWDGARRVLRRLFLHVEPLWPASQRWATAAGRWAERAEIGGRGLPALLMRPGSAWTATVRLRERPRLCLALGILPTDGKENDGDVRFSVVVARTGGGSDLHREWAVPVRKARRRWKGASLDLSRFKNQEVEVRLEVAAPPKTGLGWAAWGRLELEDRRRPLPLIRRELARMRREGLRRALARYRSVAADSWPAIVTYESWLRRNGYLDLDLPRLRREAATFSERPKISVITPVFNTDPLWLRRCVLSVVAQSYQEWELCLCDDGSSSEGTRDCLAEMEGVDPRIKVVRLTENRGIAAASNAALAAATGDFVALLDHDDELTPDALHEVAKCIDRDPQADLVYSDEDKIDPQGSLCEPFCKPDWSPEYLRSTMYLGHLCVFRRSLVQEIGGFRSDFDGAQDYDLALRAAERVRRVSHVPRILYHWRKLPHSAARSTGAKPWAYQANRRALLDHLSRLGLAGRVDEGPAPGFWRVHYEVVGEPLATIVVLRNGSGRAWARSLRAIVERTAYRNFELLIVGEDRPATRVIRALEGRTYRFLTTPGCPAARFNAAAREARGDHLVLLGEVGEVLEAEWLSAMLGLSQQEPIGAVGAKICQRDGSLWHVGLILGLGNGVGRPFSGLPNDHPGYYGGAWVLRNYSAVAGACLATRRRVFEEVGGLDETMGDLWDVDYCLRVQASGYRVAYTPQAVLRRGGAGSFAGAEAAGTATAEFRQKWAERLDEDPFYNPNLTRVGLDYALRE